MASAGTAKREDGYSVTGLDDVEVVEEPVQVGPGEQAARAGD